MIVEATAEELSQPTIAELERKLTKSEDALRYILAGKAIFTLRSVETGKRFTYKVTKAKKKFASSDQVYFVALLTGSDNNYHYSYIGLLDPKQQKKVTATRGSFSNFQASEVSKYRPSLDAIDFTMRWLYSQPFMTPKIEIWHSGRCGRCAKRLTVPESIAAGIGPYCAARM